MDLLNATPQNADSMFPNITFRGCASGDSIALNTKTAVAACEPISMIQSSFANLGSSSTAAPPPSSTAVSDVIPWKWIRESANIPMKLMTNVSTDRLKGARGRDLPPCPLSFVK